MVINKRIKRVLLENKAQYIGCIVLIILSSFVFTMMSQFADNFERLANEFQVGYIQEDATFTTDKSIDNLQELESTANAMIEEGKTFDYTLSEGKTLRIFSENDRVNIPAIIDGKELSGSGEILISPVFAKTHNYRIGDELNILDKTFTISGFTALPNYIYPLQSEEMMMPVPGFGIAVISKEDFAALNQGSNFYAVKFNDIDRNLRRQSAEFRELLKSRNIDILKWTNIEDNKRVNVVDAQVDILNLVSNGVPTGILLLAIILIGNVIGRMINRESAIIGALYALGYRRKELYRHYLTFPLMIAIIGGIIGTILGIFPVRFMVSFMFDAYIIPLTGIQYNPINIIIGLILPILFLVCGSYFVIRKELKHSPVDLMKGKKDKNKVNFLESGLKLEKLKFPTRFKIKGQLRSLSRLAFLLFGVAGATMLLLWGFTLKSGFDDMLTGGSVYNFEYEYKFDKLRYEPLPADSEPFQALLFLPENDDKRDFYVTGILPDSALITLVDESGTKLSTNQVIVTKPIANLLKLKEGDTVDIVSKLDGRIFSVEIDAIADTYEGRFIFMPIADFNEKFEMPEGSYVGVFSNVLLDIPENQSYSVVSLKDKLAAIEEVLGPTQSMMSVLAVIAFIIGMIVIYLVTSMIVEENKGTISLMKICGYRKKEINSLILNSSTIVVVIGYIIGVPLTLSALGVLVQSLENSVGMSLPPLKIDLPYILIGFIAVMLAYELSKLLCKKKVNAVSMSEALKAGAE
ncbi:putative ABC transport system permease protein [Anaerovirgula multivorans]|uniref:Putative ABC transport system permease protein n=1 Tax=Anaerovirgula multivorans TaxID=312168 RepID=A0A239I1A4_9FIRM|nr:FtsX-like permease family protein [Anaerovirgula multivorans]SNS87616.1 putative ABC transport system permease protein [Anaerovirgula multivorans]